MDFTSIWNTITDVLILPIIIAIATAIILVAKSCFNRISKSVVAKNELAVLESQAAIRQKLITMIDDSVKAAVAQNMSKSKDIKNSNSDHRLSEEEANELKESAHKWVLATLPSTLTNESSDSELLSILGGKDKLDAIIDSLIEKYVYEYKIDEI